MNRLAVAWVAALALSTVGVAAAQTTSGPGPSRPGHVQHPMHPFRPNPPIGRRTPQPVRQGHMRNNGHGAGANGAFIMVPPDYVQSALATPVRTPKPRPTASSMYETFYTVKNHR
jgi:hypothetical protein